MLDRIHRILKPLCAGLALLIVYQASRIAGDDPLQDVVIPTVKTNSSPAQPAPAVTKPVAAPAGVKPVHASSPGGALPAGATFPGPMPRSPGSKPADVDPAIQARLDRIKDSEIFGPVPRPLPMALLGIAGRDVFLRTATGQTGLVREGETLGGVRILRISTNRVLIEHEGEQKELTIFSGFGSESLLSEGKEKRQ